MHARKKVWYSPKIKIRITCKVCLHHLKTSLIFSGFWSFMKCSYIKYYVQIQNVDTSFIGEDERLQILIYDAQPF